MKSKVLLFFMLFAYLTFDNVKADNIKADFYVSTKGSDKWSGKLSEPNKDGTDGPFATLEKAKMAVRDLKENKKDDITVYIRGGEYKFSKTVIFDLKDSGNDGSMITYSAYPGEKPVFSGGFDVNNWKKLDYKVEGLPDEANGHVLVASVEKPFLSLYDEEGILPRARTEMFIPLKGGKTNKVVCPKGIIQNWKNIRDIDVVVRPHHAWIMNILPVTDIDFKNNTVMTGTNSTYAMNVLHFLRDTKSCWLENVITGLKEPGNWVYNSEEKKVYLWPRNNSKVTIPVLMEVLKIEGNINENGEDIPVRNITIKGITFKHADTYRIDADDKGLQHDWDFLDKNNAIVRLRGTENCVVDDCHFIHTGSGAIRVDLYGQNNKITNNHIEHIGGGGILLCGYGPGNKDVNKNNLVYNNHVHHVGEIFWHSPGIFLWQSGKNRVANNLIHNTNYTGLIISGFITHFIEKKKGRELVSTIRRSEIASIPENPTIDFVRPYLHTNDNVIEYNEIHHVMEKMGDGNAIYIRGAGSNNVIRYNYIHDLVAPMIMQCAVRTDGGQMDTSFEKNIIYRCTSQGIMLKLNNKAINNFVIDVLEPPRGYYLSLREAPMNDAEVKKNIFYSTKKVVEFINELKPGQEFATEDARGRAVARCKDIDTDYNIYYCKANPELGDEFLKKQQKDGIDKNSASFDPMFVDPQNGDFRFKPNSPALKMGIEPIDMSKIGLRKK